MAYYQELRTRPVPLKTLARNLLYQSIEEMAMKVAVPEYVGRVSPVFDTSQTLWVIDREDEGQTCFVVPGWSRAERPHRPSRLRELGVDVLLCGGISCWMVNRITSYGIKVVPWIAGGIDDVLQAFFEGRLGDKQFAMPGCCGQRRYHRSDRICYGRNR